MKSILALTLLLVSATSGQAVPVPEVVGKCKLSRAGCTSFGAAGSPTGLQPCPSGLTCCDTDGTDDILFTDDDDYCMPVNKPDWVGMFSQRNTPGSRQKNPGVRGRFVQAEWNKIESDVANDNQLGGVFDWSYVETQLESAVVNNQYIFIKLYFGNNIPKALLSAEPPTVTNGGLCTLGAATCNGKVPTLNGWVPVILSQNYKYYYYRMVERFIAFLANQPTEIRERIVGVQATTSHSGDPGPPTGTGFGSVNNAQSGETWENACYDDVSPATPTVCNPGLGSCSSSGTPCSIDEACPVGETCGGVPLPTSVAGGGNPGVNTEWAGNTNIPAWWHRWTRDAWAKYETELARHPRLSHVRLIVNPTLGVYSMDWALADAQQECLIHKATFVHQWYGTGEEWREPLLNMPANAYLYRGSVQWQAGQYTRFAPHPLLGDRDIRGRGEFGRADRGTSRAATAILWQAPSSQYYWNLLWFLTYGMDVPDYHPTGSLGEYPDFWSNFLEDKSCAGSGNRWNVNGPASRGNLCAQNGMTNRLFAKYSGFKSPQDSIGAFIAFRQPIDIGDFDSWPGSGVCTREPTRSCSRNSDCPTNAGPCDIPITPAREASILNGVDCAECTGATTPAARGAYVEPGHYIGRDPSPYRHLIASAGPGTCSGGFCASGQWSGSACRSDSDCDRYEGVNDSGVRDIYPSDYGMFLRLLDAQTDTVGWWRVGWRGTAADATSSWTAEPRTARDALAASHSNWPLDRNQPFGRFARSFRGGRTRIRLDLEDGFWFGRTGGLDGAYPVIVRVVYYDAGDGARWKLCYDDPDDVATCLGTQTSDSGNMRWREYTVEIADFDGDNGGPGGADLWLEKIGNLDTKFHMVEVTRAKGFRVGYFGACEAAKGRGVSCPEGEPCATEGDDSNPLPGPPPAVPNLRRTDRR